MEAMRYLTLVLMTGLSLVQTGCHCCGVSECYSDVIDDVSDKDLCLDRYYCEKLDVTRWCMNRQCGCRHDGQHCPRCGR